MKLLILVQLFGVFSIGTSYYHNFPATVFPFRQSYTAQPPQPYYSQHFGNAAINLNYPAYTPWLKRQDYTPIYHRNTFPSFISLPPTPAPYTPTYVPPTVNSQASESTLATHNNPDFHGYAFQINSGPESSDFSNNMQQNSQGAGTVLVRHNTPDYHGFAYQTKTDSGATSHVVFVSGATSSPAFSTPLIKTNTAAQEQEARNIASDMVDPVKSKETNENSKKDSLDLARNALREMFQSLPPIFQNFDQHFPGYPANTAPLISGRTLINPYKTQLFSDVLNKDAMQNKTEDNQTESEIAQESIISKTTFRLNDIIDKTDKVQQDATVDYSESSLESSSSANLDSSMLTSTTESLVPFVSNTGSSSTSNNPDTLSGISSTSIPDSSSASPSNTPTDSSPKSLLFSSANNPSVKSENDPSFSDITTSMLSQTGMSQSGITGTTLPIISPLISSRLASFSSSTATSESSSSSSSSAEATSSSASSETTDSSASSATTGSSATALLNMNVRAQQALGSTTTPESASESSVSVDSEDEPSSAPESSTISFSPSTGSTQQKFLMIRYSNERAEVTTKLMENEPSTPIVMDTSSLSGLTTTNSPELMSTSMIGWNITNSLISGSKTNTSISKSEENTTQELQTEVMATTEVTERSETLDTTIGFVATTDSSVTQEEPQSMTEDSTYQSTENSEQDVENFTNLSENETTTEA